jgi:DNA-binding response OmpR family regulator
MNLINHTVSQNGKPVELTSKEFDILRYFLEHKNEVLTRQMLCKAIWDEDNSRMLSNIIDVHLAHLRKKLDDNEQKFIYTIRGVGFILKDQS